MGIQYGLESYQQLLLLIYISTLRSFLLSQSHEMHTWHIGLLLSPYYALLTDSPYTGTAITAPEVLQLIPDAVTIFCYKYLNIILLLKLTEHSKQVAWNMLSTDTAAPTATILSLKSYFPGRYTMDLVTHGNRLHILLFLSLPRTM